MKKSWNLLIDTDGFYMRRKDDMLWKGILEEVFEDFMQFFFPHARKLYDIKRGFEFLDKGATRTKFFG